MSSVRLLCPRCGYEPNLGVRMPAFSQRPEDAVHRVFCEACGLATLPEELIPEDRRSILKGGGAPAIPAVIPPVVPIMAYNQISRSAGYNVGPTITLGYFDLAAGSTLVVSLAYYFLSDPVDGLSYGGTPLIQATSNTLGIAGILDQWTLRTPTALVNQPLVLNVSTMGLVNMFMTTFAEVTNTTVGADRTKFAVGSSTTPDSGNTALTSAANEVYCGLVGWATTAISGSWQDGFTAANSFSVTDPSEDWAMEDGFKIVTSIGTPRAAKTGCTNVGWGANIVTIR